MKNKNEGVHEWKQNEMKGMIGDELHRIEVEQISRKRHPCDGDCDGDCNAKARHRF